MTPRAIVNHSALGANAAAADHQQALATAAVADDGQWEQQPGEHEPVGAADPLQPRLVGVEALLDAGERDREDRVVDDDDRQREAQHAQRAPSVLVAAGEHLHRAHGMRVRSCRFRRSGPSRPTPRSCRR
jgi:hypothetical protein